MSGVLEPGITLADWADDVTRKTNLLRNDEDRVCARLTQPLRVSVDGSRYGTTKTMFVPIQNGLRTCPQARSAFGLLATR